jgi:hypothetical protein
MIEELWTSPAKNENGVPFYSVKQTDNWYVFGERLGVDSVAFILYDKTTGLYGVINELKPPLGTDVYKTTAFGGSLDKDLLLEEIVTEEVKEEAGYTVIPNCISYCGKVLVSTQMNQMCHLYHVDVTGLPLGERDLQEGEHGSTVQWITEGELYALEDWKALTILTKYKRIYGGN